MEPPVANRHVLLPGLRVDRVEVYVFDPNLAVRAGPEVLV